MCSGLQCHAALRYLRKCLLHRFRCRRHVLFQNDFACFIQNTVERPAIAKVQTNREFVSFENHVSIYPNSASLFHSRSPFLCALSTSNTGSVSHPAETGLLIPSDKFYKRKSQEKHPCCGRIFSYFPAPVNERGWFYKRKSQEKHPCCGRIFSYFPAPVNERGWF